MGLLFPVLSLFFQLGIQCIPKAVAYEVEGEHNETDNKGRDEHLMGTGAKILRRIVAHGSQTGKRRLQADAQIA